MKNDFPFGQWVCDKSRDNNYLENNTKNNG